jgi:osmotically-inducible protein OsmY
MKIRDLLILASPVLLAAGCAYNERTSRYGEVPVYGDEVVSTPDYTPTTPAAPVYSTTRVSQGSGATGLMTDSDRELVTSVRHQFDRYGDLSGLAPNIQVTALNGTVTLTGSVPNERDRQMVEAMVRNTAGVVGLHNQLTIADPRTPTASQADRALEYQVRQSLNNQPTLVTASRNVRITARNGTVTLSGTVPAAEDRQLIESITRNTAGVATVIDEIQIAFQPTGRPGDVNRVYSASTGDIFNLHVQGLTDNDRVLAQRILEGLRTDPSLNSFLPSVDINVSESKVTLQGTVQSEQQRQMIVSAIRRAAGSDNVLDLLKVQQPIR